MREPLSAEMWAAGRSLIEGAAPTHARVAACMGVNATTVSHRAAQEEWRGLDFRSPRVRQAHRHFVELAARNRKGEPLDPVDAEDVEALAAIGAAATAALPPLPDLPEAERRARLRGILAGRVEEMLRLAEAGRPIEARQVAALASLVQLMEKVMPAPTDGEVGPGGPEADADEELRDVLRKIDDRIAYLAAGYAATILMEKGLSEREANAAVLADAELRQRLESTGMLAEEGGQLLIVGV
jgi:hypothetical protein